MQDDAASSPPLLASQIRHLERIRDSRVLVLAASNLDLDLLPALYEVLRGIGRTARLDVVLFCHGGVVNAARRIALLLDEFTDHLGLLVPHHCESAGTVVALAAREIVAGQLAIFSPVDPILQTSDPASTTGPDALHAEDVRLFGKMSSEWFGASGPDGAARALSTLCENIFPTTLTSFYRSTLQLQQIGAELLALHASATPPESRAAIVDNLLFGYHSHTHALTRKEMQELGLPMRRDEAAEELAWQISCGLRAAIGAGLRVSPDDDWFDAMLATRDGVQVRRRGRAALAGTWQNHRDQG